MKIIETHTVPAIGEKIRLQEYAASIFNTITTRNGIKKAIKREEILIDGEIAKTSDWIREKQVLQLRQPTPSEKKIFQLNLEVIFEDEFFAVINKPAGFPTSGNYFKTIENSLPYNLFPSVEEDALPRPLPVHRLDNPTTGLLLIAKTRNVQTVLNRDFMNKKIIKTYLAIVHGKAPEDILITAEIVNKLAITQVISLNNFKNKNREYSLIEAVPKTGRTHQIRIHLSEKGFPIVGDKLYGKEGAVGRKNLFLAATALKFIHPVTGEELNLKLPVPKRFERFISSS